MTEEDIASVLAAAALDPELPFPDRWGAGSFTGETRLKFNAPTPVFSIDITMEWFAPTTRKLVFHALLWVVDDEWEVFAVDGL